jgi:hypothetical protein
MVDARKYTDMPRGWQLSGTTQSGIRAVTLAAAGLPQKYAASGHALPPCCVYRAGSLAQRQAGMAPMLRLLGSICIRDELWEWLLILSAVLAALFGVWLFLSPGEGARAGLADRPVRHRPKDRADRGSASSCVPP